MHKLIKNFEPNKLRFNEMMSGHTTFRIGGPAALMLLPDCTEDIVLATKICKEAGLPMFVIGGGSNLLIKDKGIDAIVIKIAKNFATLSRQGDYITAQAGASLAALAAFARQQGLSGLEFAAGIPGTLGGAVYMNAGAYNAEMSDILVWARVLRNDEIVVLDNKQLGLSYRTSCIQSEGGVVLEACLKLCPADPQQIADTMNKLAKQRRAAQPLEYPNAGSTFKRPAGLFAGKLIEDAGLKGLAVGGAQVSVKHAGFIINVGGATAKDVTDLVGHVQYQVHKQFGVDLQLEIQII